MDFLKLRADARDIDRWAALLAGGLMIALAAFAFWQRYGWLADKFPGALFWDAQVLANAGAMIADGGNAYFGDMISNPFGLPFISPPQMAMFLAGLATVFGPALFPLMAAAHIAAMIIVPLILTRLFLGPNWQDSVLGYGLFVCGLGAFGVTTVLVGNFGTTCYLLIFAGMAHGLKTGKWFWFYAACAFGAQLKPPYLALMIVPVMVNGWSWKELRNAVITAAVTGLPFAISYLVSPAYFADWLGALDKQVGVGDHGWSVFGAVSEYSEASRETIIPKLAHVAVMAPLFFFLLFDRARGLKKAAALVAFAVLANPRMKEYDAAFIAVPVAALYLGAIAGIGDPMRRALGIGAILLLTGLMLRADQAPVLGPFIYSIVITGGILALAFQDRKQPAPTAAAHAE